jgi:hypothetical protein
MGVPNSNRAEMDAGTERHRMHGKSVERARRLQLAAMLCGALALAACLLLVARLAGLL